MQFYETTESNVFQYANLRGTSFLIAGSGLIAFDSTNDGVRIRFGMHAGFTALGLLCCVVSVLLLLFVLPLYLFWLICGQVSLGVVTEFDRIVSEVEGELNSASTD